MLPDSHLENWLSLWEELREKRGPVPLEHFIQEHCQDAPTSLIEEFKAQVRVLESIDADFKAAGGFRTLDEVMLAMPGVSPGKVEQAGVGKGYIKPQAGFPRPGILVKG